MLMWEAWKQQSSKGGTRNKESDNDIASYYRWVEVMKMEGRG